MSANDVDESLIIMCAADCAADAVVQGLRPANLTRGWELSKGDADALGATMGRPLTQHEWKIAAAAFEQRVIDLCLDDEDDE